MTAVLAWDEEREGQGAKGQDNGLEGARVG